MAFFKHLGLAPWRSRSTSSERALLRLARFGIVAFIALDAAILIGLTSFAAWRKRRTQFQGFPHETLPDVAVGDNKLRVFTYGRDLYASMLAAIESAQESIYFETYIWKDDAVGQQFKDALIRKAESGVDVYCIFDGFGNLVVPRKFKTFPNSVHVLEHFDIQRPWHVLDPRRYALDHRKILVVDGQTSFLGGYNIGSMYETEWRDTHVRIEGPASAQLAQLFVSFWHHHANSDDPIKRHYPRHFDPHLVPQGNDAMRLSFPIRDMYIAAIDRAESHILLTNAYFIPDTAFLQSLTSAARRGVSVQVLLPWNSNHSSVDWLARGAFSECLRAGVRLFGYKAMIHAKTCTIDGQWSTIGTANLDRLSSVGNYELNLEIYSPEIAQRMEAFFHLDKRNAIEVTEQHWESRPLVAKVVERLLSPWRNVL